MRRIITRSLLSVATVALLTTTLLPAGPAWSQSDKSERRYRAEKVIESLETFGRVYERLTRNYVEELDPEELIEAAIDGMLADLDPHTQLLKAEMYDDLMTSTQGEFGGLGIQITIRDGYPTVISPIDGTPASRLGIRGGDQIVEIEGESTEGWRSSDAVKVLRGPKGTKVNIGIRRPGQEKILPFTITRDIIEIESVPYAFMLDEQAGIGYIRISNFARDTADELSQHIGELEDQGMESLILDLRFNPGGLLQSARDVSELFLERDDLIVYTEGRLAQQNMKYFATSDEGKVWKEEKPLVVLINGSSASASEILSGAVQDHDVGIVVGEDSFGKGSVQTVFELTPSEALKLTTAKYFTPSGRSIHKDRMRNGQLVHGEDEESSEGADEVEAEDSVADASESEKEDREVFHTDMGREVYGGGGIHPDIEIEPTLLTDFAVAIERDATFFHYTNQWLLDHEAPEGRVEVTDEMVAEFRELMDEREDLPGYFEDLEVEFDDELFQENLEFVRTGIRREIARRAGGNNAAYRVSIENDGQVWKVVELLRDNPTREQLFEAAQEFRKRKLAEADEKEADSGLN